jgi:choline-sulfatase
VRLKHTRRNFLKRGALALGAAVNHRLRAAQKKAPYNVLLLMTDEHSPHYLHCDGNELVQTPTLDALAAAGRLFTAAYCQNPICVPSRASLITGKMPTHVDTFNNNGGLPDDAVTMAKVFSKAGYVCEWLGKEHWGGDPGFGSLNKTQEAERKVRCRMEKDFLNKIGRLPHDAAISPFPVEQTRETVATDYALQFLDAQAGQAQPFFLGLSFAKPHFPFTTQQKFYDLYKGKVTPPAVEKGVPETLPPAEKKTYEKYRLAEMTPEMTVKAIEIYYGMVTYADSEFARVIKKIDELGLRDSTIILYTSDHGEMAGEHGLWYKNSFYEASARVPFIWSFPPKIPAGKRVDAPVMNIDIFPTLCELCGIPEPAGLEGRSLMPLMTGKEDGINRYALSESYNAGGGRMVRKGKYKYIWYEAGGERLYDLEADPGELVNLAEKRKYATVIAELKPLATAGYRSLAEMGGWDKKTSTKAKDTSKTSETETWLKKNLSKYPDSDANADGILTTKEWKKYKREQGIETKKK